MAKSVVTPPAALGGEGWIPRLGSLRDNQESVWSAFGATSECGRLRSVLMRCPGPEIETVHDVRQALWLDLVDPIKAREQHDALTRLYRAHGVEVSHVPDVTSAKPNLYFMRDTFAMTPEGAILSRPASRNRAGEERVAAQALSQLGVPIVLSVHGHGTFEGADLMIVNEDLAIVAEGQRTNRNGADQVERLLREIGFQIVLRVNLPADCLHLDCALSIVNRDLALVIPGQTPAEAVSTLRYHGFRILGVPNARETQRGMAINLVALEPGLVVMPAGNPETRHVLEKAGVTCLEVEISELMNGGGAIHCMTGVIRRDA
jgi:N-dimethylarginine dimethylaminohydrolase